MPILSPTRIRALFVDIDGTLVSADESISPEVRRTLERAQENGVEVVLCTGRTRYRMNPIAEQMPGAAGYAVCSNGGVVSNHGTGEILYRHLLPVQDALRIVNAIVEADAEPYVFEDSDVPGIEGARVLYHPELNVGAWADKPRYRPYADLLTHLPFAPVSVSAFGSPEKMRPIAQRLMRELRGKVSIIQSGSLSNWGVEVYVANVNKLLGVQEVTARLGVERAEVLAIGDHVNDKEMLEWAGVGVAMENALPEIRDAADWITASVQQDGVARAIERFILS